MKWLLVDRHGAVFSATSSKHSDDMVAKAGAALIGFSDTCCHIRIRPSLIELQGFAVLSRLLRDAKPDRIMISWFGSEWHQEIIPNRHDAIERLLELALEPQPVDRFFRRARPLDDLEVSHQLSPLIDLWRANGSIDLRQDFEAIADHTNGKYLVVSQENDSRQVKFVEFGKTKWAVYGSSQWTTRCLGQPVQFQPDYEYGCWTADGYRDAMLGDVPTLSDMDTIIIDPVTGGERHLLYKRLTLPVRGSDNTMQLLSTSCHDLSVSLRPPIN